MVYFKVETCWLRHRPYHRSQLAEADSEFPKTYYFTNVFSWARRCWFWGVWKHYTNAPDSVSACAYRISRYFLALNAGITSVRTFNSCSRVGVQYREPTWLKTCSGWLPGRCEPNNVHDCKFLFINNEQKTKSNRFEFKSVVFTRPVKTIR